MRRNLGQHFLLDPGICARIAALGGDLTGRSVVEIGPGPGGLTRALLDTPASRVDVVEIDERAWPCWTNWPLTTRTACTSSVRTP